MSGCMLHALGMRGAGSSFAHRSRSATDPTSGPINNIANGGAGEKSFRNGSHCRGQAGAATSFTTQQTSGTDSADPVSHRSVRAFTYPEFYVPGNQREDRSLCRHPVTGHRLSTVLDLYLRFVHRIALRKNGADS